MGELNRRKKEKVDKKKGSFAWLFIWLAIMVFVFYQIYGVIKYTLGKPVNKFEIIAYTGLSKIIKLSPSINKVDKTNLTIGCLSDISIPSKLASGYYSNAGYDYDSIFENVKEDISKYDVTIASLDTPVTGKVSKLKSTRDTTEDILKSLKTSGVDVLATATSHMLDMKGKGVEETFANIEKQNIGQTGITKDKTEITPYIIDKNGIKVAVLSYTASTNMKETKDSKGYVNIYDKEKLIKDVKISKDKGVDYIISYLCAGEMNQTRTDAEKKELTQELISNGVDVVIGTHSRMVQGSYEDIIESEDSKQRHVYVVYGLGDFIGEQAEDNTNTSSMIGIKITKTINKDNKGKIVDSNTYLQIEKDIQITALSNSNRTKYKLVNVEKVLKEYEEAKNNRITDVEYKYLKEQRNWYEKIVK